MSIFKNHSPENMADPVSAYAHGVSVEGATRWLHISGQVGARSRDGVSADSAKQMNKCWERIFAVLADAGMDKTNLVKINVYMTRPEDVELYREIREQQMEGHITASTLLIVSGFADPSWVVEIEAIAAA
ncbi:MAG: RidA family protein [Rhodospirillales bacterium]|jgi:2-iminobutanoate/2-iminopropanoate deaminase|nr:RidA family protein [Rhodospirillales bacterium]